MLHGQTHKPAKSFKRRSKIQAFPFHGNSMLTPSFPVSSQTLISPAGEYIGQGQTYYTTNQVDIAISWTPSTVTLTSLGFMNTMAAPDQSNLTVDQYSNVVQYPFNGNAAGLNVSAVGRSCTNVCGNFQVLELQTNTTGQLTHFWATFTQRCNCSIRPLTGEVRYNSLLAPPNPLPRTLRVPTDYSSIQAAITNASVLVPETVLVAPGTYRENIDFQGKAVSVISERGPEETIIDGNYNQVPVVTIVSHEGSNSVISGFTIENGFNNIRGGGGSGISVEFSSPTITRNIFRNNRQGAGPGAAIGCNGASPIIAQNLFIHNPGYGSVIGCFNTSSPLIDNNVFFDNPGTAVSARCPTVINNTFVSNNVCILFDSSGCAFYANNIFVRNGAAVLANFEIDFAAKWSHNLVFGGQGYVGVRDQTGTNGNISADPFFTCEPGGNFHLLSSSPCIDAGTNIAGLIATTDFDGQPRIQPGSTNGSPVVDLGAFEFAFSNPPVACLCLFCPTNIVVMAPPGQVSAVVNYPAPFASPVATVSTSPASGSIFSEGDDPVAVTTVYGTNVLNCSFTVRLFTTTNFARALNMTNTTWLTPCTQAAKATGSPELARSLEATLVSSTS
jgi:hypothetical protein